MVAGQSKLDGAHARAAADGSHRHLSLFGDVLERVRANYVEKPDDGKLISSAINGMLSGLDPHSSYLDANRARPVWKKIARAGRNEVIAKGPINTRE